MGNKRMSAARAIKRRHIIVKETSRKKALVTAGSVEEGENDIIIRSAFRRSKRGKLTLMQEGV